MSSLDDVRRLALALPETAERASYGGAPSWTVRDKAFVFERPLRKADLAVVEPVDGPILGVYTGSLEVKEQLLAEEPAAAFTIPHLDGYPGVLFRLDEVDEQTLEELVTDAWLARAPKRLAATWLQQR